MSPLIEKINASDSNLEPIRLNPPSLIREKLDYFRSYFNKTHDLDPAEFEKLKKEIAVFFNGKPVSLLEDSPKGFVRISNNNRILAAQGKEPSYLTDISQLLAPPVKYCDFNRCNIPGQQVLYCATTEAAAYWEIKPRNGDIITISHFRLKPNATLKCSVIKTEKTKDPQISHEMHEVFYMLESFFIDVYSLPVSRERVRDYLFSAILSSEQLFYPVTSPQNIEAILYPSVQKKKFGQNIAIRNDIVLDRYELEGIETRFILNEYDNVDPATEDLTTDDLIGSFGTKTFDFEKGKILWDARVDEVFKLFRNMQTQGWKQTRYETPEKIKRLDFDLSLKDNPARLKPQKGYERNQKVNVIYQDGLRKDKIKYKFVEDDIREGRCRIVF